MKNADVIEGQAYAWSRYKPRGDDPLAKVIARGTALAGRGRHPVTGRTVEFAEDFEPRWGAMIPKGTIRAVPARELVGPWDDHAEKAEADAVARAEGARLVEEIGASLAALGIEGAHVFAAPAMGDVKVTIQVYGADRAQALSDALSFAVSAKEVGS